jgi:hypothetical protein
MVADILAAYSETVGLDVGLAGPDTGNNCDPTKEMTDVESGYLYLCWPWDGDPDVRLLYEWNVVRDVYPYQHVLSARLFMFPRNEGPTGYFNDQSTFCHEFGHLLRLNHGNPGCMDWTSSCPEAAAITALTRLHAHDDGVQHMVQVGEYEQVGSLERCSGTPVQAPTPTPTATPTSEPTPEPTVAPTPTESPTPSPTPAPCRPKGRWGKNCK